MSEPSEKVILTQYVTVEQQPDGKQSQTCKFCGYKKASVIFQATKWGVHLLSCANAPEDLKERIVKSTKSREIHEAARSLVDGVERSQGQSDPVAATSSSASSNLSDHITVVKVEGESKQPQTCRYCGKTKSSSMFQSTKWAVHLLQCPSVPFATRESVLRGSRSREVFEAALKVDGLESLAAKLLAAKGAKSTGTIPEAASAATPTTTTITATATATPRVGALATPPPKRQKTGLSSYYKKAASGVSRGDLCDLARAERINLAIMKFLAACAIPMVVVESPHFLELLKTLNSSYVSRFLAKSDVFVNTWLPALFKSVEEQTKKIWSAEKNMKRTLGLEAFLEADSKVCMFTESFASKTTFQECTIESNSDSTSNASILLKQMETIAQERVVEVEDHFCAVTLVDANMDSIDEEFAKYPKIFVNGCRSHCLETIYKDISNVEEVSQVLHDATMITEVIVSHPAVKNAFLRCSGGTMLVRPGSRNLNDVLDSLVSNSKYLQALVNDENWDTYAYYVARSAHFVKLVSSDSTFEKFRCLKRVFSCLSLVWDHVERRDFRSSWIVPLFEALANDVRDWTGDEAVGTFFSRETRELVQLAVEDWWRNYNSDQYLVAALCDPAVFPAKESLPSDWLTICGRVSQRFYSGRQQLDVRQEIMKVVAGTGMYGEEVEQRRKEAAQLEHPESASKVEMVVKRQELFASESPHLLWETVFYREFPLLSEIASRLLVMSTRSNSLERACNVRNLSKACDRLSIKRVYMLLYCHINLRLSSDSFNGQSMDGFLEQAILDHAGLDDSKNHADSEGSKKDAVI